ncbi:hypothetical protein [Aminobacterium colombiense]
MAKRTVLKNSAGKRVPSVSTIVGQLDKPGLVYWAHKLGLAGVENLRDHRDAIGKAGNLAHDLAIPYLSGVDIHTTIEEVKDDYTQEEIELAIPIMDRFRAWAEQHEFKTAFAEKSIVSDIYDFGGRFDWYGLVDGVPTLIDFKFTKDIYPDHSYQLAAYAYLLKEKMSPPEASKIIRFGREEAEGFEERALSGEALDLSWQVFCRLLDVYSLVKRLKKADKEA